MHRLSELEIYNQALDLSVDVYSFTKSFPDEEKFGLISQIRRAASSIGANIAEGYGRRTAKDQVHFFYQAKGSLSEVIFFAELSLRLEYIDNDKYQELIDRYTKLDVKIYNYINYIQKVK